MTVCEDMLIPFMQETGPTKLIFDGTNVYHNDKIYDVLEEVGIDVYPSACRPHNVEGGYPPNSHDCMPIELINGRLKEKARKAFDKLRKSRQNVKSLQTVVTKPPKV